MLAGRRRCCCGAPHDRCTVTICVTGCDGTPLVGAFVQVKKSGVLVGSCTTATGGCCNVTILIADSNTSFEIIISDTGYVTYDGFKTLVCNTTYTIKLRTVASGPTATFQVTGCGSVAPAPALEGALVTLSCGGGGDTDASGIFETGITGTVTCNWTVSKNRFITQTGSFTNSVDCPGSITISVVLLPASGYHCACSFLPDPLPDTLHLTDSAYGSTTLTYDAGSGLWIGTLAASYSAYQWGLSQNCVADTFTLTYYFPDGYCGTTVQYTIHGANGTTSCPGSGPGSLSQTPSGGTTHTTSVPYSATSTFWGCDYVPPSIINCSGGVAAHSGSSFSPLYPSDTTLSLTE